MSIALMLIAPLLVSLALKIRSLVGVDQSAASLSEAGRHAPEVHHANHHVW